VFCTRPPLRDELRRLLQTVGHGAIGEVPFARLAAYAMRMSVPTQWNSPPTIPPDGWDDNVGAVRSRTYFLWALGVLLSSWAAAAGLASIQVVGVLVSWVGGLSAIALAIAAIWRGYVGVIRAEKLDGYRRRPALLGLLGGIAVLVAAPGILLLSSFMLIAW
jgi:hypothetical protein